MSDKREPDQKLTTEALIFLVQIATLRFNYIIEASEHLCVLYIEVFTR